VRLSEEAELTWALRMSSLLVSDQPQMLQLPAERSQGTPWVRHTGPKPSAARLKLLEAEGEGVYMVAGPGEGKEVRGNEIAGVVLQGVTSRSEDWSCKNWYF
jgi:hypothetical protein